ncbi:unnamed protein product [Meloidogyne enterolobii]|uniref:Uncharacterized protein n=1 Tax=Meloidogyne enterolobii TaxID=390850 RepID=A0ACB1AZ05_MELEN
MIWTLILGLNNKTEDIIRIIVVVKYKEKGWDMTKLVRQCVWEKREELNKM